MATHSLLLPAELASWLASNINITRGIFHTNVKLHINFNT